MLGIKPVQILHLLHPKKGKDFFNDFISITDETLESTNEQLHSNLLVRNLKIFEEVENAGSEIFYKCNPCQDCQIYKDHEQT